jgi:outer membrane receptor protein involved in Fe transport
VGSGSGLTGLYSETVRNSGVFGQVKLDLRNTVFVSAGLRGERNSNFGKNLRTAYSPMLGIAVTQDAGQASVKFRAAYGKGIRPPAPAMRAAIRTISFRQLENPELEPEVQAGTEAGVEVYMSDRLNLSVTAFAQRAEGLIQQVVTNPRERVRTIQYQNVGEIGNTGFEVEGSGRLGIARADLVFTHTNSRVRGLASSYTGDLALGDQVPEVPSASGMLSLSVEHDRWRASAGATYLGEWTGYDWVAYYTGELSPNTARPLLRDYLTKYPSLTRPFVGLTFAMSRHAEWTLRLDNLTNIQQNERDNLQIGAGRTATVGLRVAR